MKIQYSLITSFTADILPTFKVKWPLIDYGGKRLARRQTALFYNAS